MAKKQRLIDADALKAHINGLSTHCLNDWSTLGVLAAVDKQPTVDAVEVVHGRWETEKDIYFELHIIKCSVCREEWCFEEQEDVVALHYKYCPNCGAMMDLMEVQDATD